MEDVGLGEQRPDRGTYGGYEFDRLPPLPFTLCGDLAWLAAAPAHDHSNVRKKLAAGNAESIKLLRAASEKLGLPLPAAFTKFAETPALPESHPLDHRLLPRSLLGTHPLSGRRGLVGTLPGRLPGMSLLVSLPDRRRVGPRRGVDTWALHV
jgi:hypothetical protein